MQQRQRSWCPPVGPAEQAHDRRHDQDANDGGINRDGDCQGDADRLDDDDARETEREKDRDHDQGRAGDQSATLFKAHRDSRLVVAVQAILLLDATDQQNLVVHRHSEHDAEQDYRQARVNRLRAEPEKLAQMPFLEDPHHRSERCRDREEVRQHGLERKDDRAGEQEKDDVCDEDHRADSGRRPVKNEVDDVKVECCFSGGEDEKAVKDDD